MPYTSFHLHFLEIAEKETRTLTILRKDDLVPHGSYGLLEMYCDDPGCDCQRVFLEVYDWERRKDMAFIAYGWEREIFYRRWFGSSNGDAADNVVKDMMGPILNPGSPQSIYAPEFLKLVKDVVLSDPAYIGRLKRHYQLFKEKVDPEHFHPSDVQKQPAPVELPAQKRVITRKRHQSRSTDN